MDQRSDVFHRTVYFSWSEQAGTCFCNRHARCSKHRPERDALPSLNWPSSMATNSGTSLHVGKKHLKKDVFNFDFINGTNKDGKHPP